MLHIGHSNNAGSFAAALGNGHAFEVRIAALFPGLGARLPEVLRQAPGHVTNGWHRAGLLEALTAVTAALTPTQTLPPGETTAGPEVVPEEAGQASDAAAMETDSDATEACSARANELEKYLETCPYAEADKAVEVTRALTGKLGKEAAMQLLRGAKQCVLKDANGKKRKVLKEGCPKGKAWRLRG